MFQFEYLDEQVCVINNLQNSSIDFELFGFFFFAVGVEIAVNNMVIVIWNLMQQVVMHALVDVKLRKEAEYLQTIQRKLGTKKDFLVLLEQEFDYHLK